MKNIPDISVPRGRYVVAVSGGIDSVVLLDLLSRQADLELVVAHFDHGIREDSAADARFVEALAAKYDVQVEIGEAALGPDASEEEARDARYHYLRKVREQHKTSSIITAHHKDDVLETAVHNLLRGTGRKGLTSLSSTDDIMRPLLRASKGDIYQYALDHALEFVQDPTNQDLSYARNRIRHTVIPAATARDAHFPQKMHAIIDKLRQLNPEIDKEIDTLLAAKKADLKQRRLSRYLVTMLPVTVAQEVLMEVIKRLYEHSRYDRSKIENALLFIKTSHANKEFQFSREVVLVVDKSYVYFQKA